VYAKRTVNMPINIVNKSEGALVAPLFLGPWAQVVLAIKSLRIFDNAIGISA